MPLVDAKLVRTTPGRDAWIMRGATAIWLLLWEPLLAVASAAILYRWFGVTG